MADETVTCPECGAEIEGEEHLHTEEVREMSVTGGVRYKSDSRDLYMCKGCGKILGVN